MTKRETYKKKFFDASTILMLIVAIVCVIGVTYLVLTKPSNALSETTLYVNVVTEDELAAETKASVSLFSVVDGVTSPLSETMMGGNVKEKIATLGMGDYSITVSIAAEGSTYSTEIKESFSVSYNATPELVFEYSFKKDTTAE